MKVIFFGTPQFAADILAYLLENGIDVVAVITKPDKPKGRSGTLLPTPVKQVAMAHGLPFYQPEIVSAPEFLPTLKQYEADLFVVVAYGEILKQHILDTPKRACINVHPSLLPKYRGAAPIQHAIMAGDAETGVTIMHMVRKMDAGDMIYTVKQPIGPNTTYGELEAILCRKGGEALLKVLRDFESGTITEVAQDETKVTLAHKIELEQCEIDWRAPSQLIHNLVRGVFPQPGAWCYVEARGQKLRLKINKTEPVKDLQGTPGEILRYGKEGVVVACGEGALMLLELQLEGKKPMAAVELARGLPKESLKFLSHE